MLILSNTLGIYAAILLWYIITHNRGLSVIEKGRNPRPVLKLQHELENID
jgi:hypothetical protein